MNAMQEEMLAGQEALKRKILAWQNNPRGDPRRVQAAFEKDQAALVDKALHRDPDAVRLRDRPDARKQRDELLVRLLARPAFGNLARASGAEHEDRHARLSEPAEHRLGVFDDPVGNGVRPRAAELLGEEEVRRLDRDPGVAERGDGVLEGGLGFGGADEARDVGLDIVEAGLAGIGGEVGGVGAGGVSHGGR